MPAEGAPAKRSCLDVTRFAIMILATSTASTTATSPTEVVVLLLRHGNDADANVNYGYFLRRQGLLKASPDSSAKEVK